MALYTNRSTTSVLLIDGDKTDRAFYAEQLKRCSATYQILEATDGKSGLQLFHSRKIDCVVTELALPDRAGFQLLGDLVPFVPKPQVAVVVLTKFMHKGLQELATKSGASACCVKVRTSGKDLDKTIQRAVARIEQRIPEGVRDQTGQFLEPDPA